MKNQTTATLFRPLSRAQTLSLRMRCIACNLDIVWLEGWLQLGQLDDAQATLTGLILSLTDLQTKLDAQRVTELPRGAMANGRGQMAKRKAA